MGDWSCSSGTCKIGGCPDACWCYYNPETNDCDCGCLGELPGPVIVVAESKRKPIPQSPILLVTISGKLPITRIAKMLDNFLPNQIAIPVAILNDEPIELVVKDKKVAEIAESLGLAVLEKKGK